jgi:tRNA dimethylallyltransferase
MVESSDIAPRIWLIAGPTASGKSAHALDLAERTGGEIVNADSMQIYAGLRVLTAGPSPVEMARAPHHLFEVVDAAVGWSVGRWLEAATKALAEIESRGNPAIIVGGTGLYFRALTHGLADVPPVSETQREISGLLYAARGEEAFREILKPLDPEAEARIETGDRQRLVRAHAVAIATGKSLTAWQTDTRPALDPALPALKAVGYRELAAHLRGETTLDQALDAARQETRRYAKRQLTWFRNQTPDWARLPGGAVSAP